MCISYLCIIACPCADLGDWIGACGSTSGKGGNGAPEDEERRGEGSAKSPKGAGEVGIPTPILKLLATGVRFDGDLEAFSTSSGFTRSRRTLCNAPGDPMNGMLCGGSPSLILPCTDPDAASGVSMLCGCPTASAYEKRVLCDCPGAPEDGLGRVRGLSTCESVSPPSTARFVCRRLGACDMLGGKVGLR
jgi:hypothetical protein